MNLKKIYSRYRSLLLLAVVFETRAIWEYSISPNIHILFFESLAAFVFLVSPFPLAALSTWLESHTELKKNLVKMFIVLLFMLIAFDLWLLHPRVLAVLGLLLGLLVLTAIWRFRLVPRSEEWVKAKRAKREALFVDRTAFEEDWQRRTKIGEGILLFIFVLLAVFFFMASSKILAFIFAAFAALFLVGLFARLTPMSDEKFEKELAKAKALYERAEDLRANNAVRRAEGAKRTEKRNEQQENADPVTGNFSSFFYWSLMLCVFGFQDRSSLTKPDLVFCAMPAWFLIRAFYFFIWQANTPTGPSAPSASEPSTSTQTI